MYVGCVAGALQKDDYLRVINKCGFENVAVVKEKNIAIPDEVLLKYVEEKELAAFKRRGTSILSITVFGRKPR